jgi:hypothetical protein
LVDEAALELMDSDPSDRGYDHMTRAQRQIPSPVTEDDTVREDFVPVAHSPVQKVQSILSTDDGINDSNEAVNASTTNRLEVFKYLTRFSSLDRVLESPHITGKLWISSVTLSIQYFVAYLST